MSQSLERYNNYLLERIAILDSQVKILREISSLKGGHAQIEPDISFKSNAVNDSNNDDVDSLIVNFKLTIKGYENYPADDNNEDDEENNLSFIVSYTAEAVYKLPKKVKLELVKEDSWLFSREVFQSVRAYMMMQIRAAGIPFFIPLDLIPRTISIDED